MLLYSFDAGNKYREPDEKALLANLRVLDKAIRSAGRENLAVVGFTEGMQFVSPGAMRPQEELGELSDFPMVSGITTASRKFNEPYNLMLEPGAILIDSKGILLAFYDHPLTERELLDAMALTDWDKPVQPHPVEDHWSGKGTTSADTHGHPRLVARSSEGRRHDGRRLGPPRVRRPDPRRTGRFACVRSRARHATT